MNREDPFHELMEMQERMKKLLEEGRDVASVSEEASVSQPWSPLVDVYETTLEIVLVAELPQVDKEDLEVEIEGGALTLQGIRRGERGEGRRTYHLRERPAGPFRRRFPLPANVDPAGITAQFVRGVLTVRLPKAPTRKKQRIEIA